MITGWTKPENRACFELKGPDAVRYLNGQISNDIKGDLAGKVVTACVCTLKGKIEAVVRVTAHPEADGLLLESEASHAEDVFTRLDRYLIADDCELIELEPAPDLIHIIAETTDIENAKEHWRYGLKGFDIYSNEIPPGLDEIDAATLLQQKVLHGIPEYGFEISGDEFPAGLGLDKWAVDFHKGCYLGQEIVSRIESAGKIPKRLRLFSTKESFTKGDTFSNDSGKEIANVVRDSIPHPDQSDRYLTSVLAKGGFENAEFEEIEIKYPPKV